MMIRGGLDREDEVLLGRKLENICEDSLYLVSNYRNGIDGMDVLRSVVDSLQANANGGGNFKKCYRQLKNIQVNGGIEKSDPVYHKLREIFCYKIPRSALRRSSIALLPHIQEDTVKGRMKDNLARERQTMTVFAESYKQLAINVANRYFRVYQQILHGLDMDDLRQMGQIGLIRAVDKYDYRRGRFASFARHWVKSSIRREVELYARTVRVPLHVNQNHKMVRDIKVDLEHKLHRRPSVEEIYDEITNLGGLRKRKVSLELVKELVEELAVVNYSHVSVDACSGDESVPLLERLEDKKSANPEAYGISEIRKSTVRSELNHLTPREEKVLRMRFGIGYRRPLTLQEVGDEFEFTRERARQVEAEAIKRLRKNRLLAELV